MKKNLFTLTCLLVLLNLFFHSYGNKCYKLNAGCSDAGVATSTVDSICYEDTTTLVLTGYIGTIQWQSYDGVNWVDETGTGSTSDLYDVIPGQTMQYRAVVTNGVCPPDTSNIALILVGTIPVPSGTGAARCGYGQVTLQGTGSGTLRWYIAPTGGVPVGIGSPFNVTVAGSTTFYLEDNVSGGSGGSSPILITEMDLGASDYLEIQNVSNQPVDVTGWKLAINNSYTDINLVNANVQVLSGIMMPGDIITYTDNAAGPNYWGSNMLWNPGAFPTFTGWTIILDDANILMDFVALNWPDANIQAMNPVIGGVPITIGTNWSGNGVDISTVAAGTGVSRQGNNDNNSLSDFVISTLSIGTTNANMILPFTGFGCSSPRVPVQVTVTPSDPVTITPGQPALCLGQSTTLTASSSNLNYNYAWSPATGLSSTIGAVVTANPTFTITYTVVGDDGTCADIDSITISVGLTSVAGTATVSTDTLCSGTNATLFLSGSTGSIQWQSFNGTMWVNETNPGFDSSQYQVSPAVTTQYRAVVTSGGCSPDTSAVLNIEVLTITDPVTVNDTICGPGVVNLFATGTGVLNWFTAPTGGTPVNTGSTFSPNLTATTTYYVEASAGGTFNVGPVTNGFGSQSILAGNDWGLQFDVIQQSTIEKVHVYPAQTGTITINLRDALGGPILNTVTANVTALTGKTPIILGFTVNPLNGYRLEMATGSVQCYFNNTNAVYPYTVAGSPLTIAGYVNPNFQTGNLYYFFYDWEVTEGCSSNRIPVTGVVLPVPPVPTINQNGSILTSSSVTGNQWNLNGTPIPGATGQVYTATQPGTYTVTVTNADGCSASSAPVVITSTEEIGYGENGIVIYPNPAAENVFIQLPPALTGRVNLRIINVSGETVSEKNIKNNSAGHKLSLKNLSPGSYLFEIKSKEGIYRKTILKM